MQNKGYTIPELIIMIIVIGVFAFVLINKASAAFVDNDTVVEDTERMILIKSSKNYANSIIDTLKEEDKYITGQDLIDAEYLIDEEDIYKNMKIKLSYDENTDSAKVEILE